MWAFADQSYAVEAHTAGSTNGPWQSLAEANLTQFLREVTSDNGQQEWRRRIVVPWDDTPSTEQSFKVVQEVLTQLLNYRATAPTLAEDSEADFIRNLGLLQDFRDYLASEKGYANALLSDVLNRLIFVNLSSRLIQDRSVSTSLQKQMSRLTDFRMSPWKLAENLKGEVVGQLTLTTSTNNQDACKAFAELLQQSAGASDPVGAMSKAVSGSYGKLLEKRNVTALLMCWLRTDSLIHLSLPLLVQYIQKNPDFALNDDYQKIKKVLALDEEKRKWFGSRLNPCHPGSEGDVQRLIRAVASSQLESVVGLSSGREKTVESKAGEEKVITRTLESIASAKEQIALLKSLHRDSVITEQEIAAYLNSPLPIAAERGKYEVGKVGEEPRFVKPDGSIIRVPQVNPHQRTPLRSGTKN